MISDQDRKLAEETFDFIERSEASGNSYEANLPIGADGPDELQARDPRGLTVDGGFEAIVLDWLKKEMNKPAASIIQVSGDGTDWDGDTEWVLLVIRSYRSVV